MTQILRAKAKDLGKLGSFALVDGQGCAALADPALSLLLFLGHFLILRINGAQRFGSFGSNRTAVKDEICAQFEISIHVVFNKFSLPSIAVRLLYEEHKKLNMTAVLS